MWSVSCRFVVQCGAKSGFNKRGECKDHRLALKATTTRLQGVRGGFSMCLRCVGLGKNGPGDHYLDRIDYVPSEKRDPCHCQSLSTGPRSVRRAWADQPLTLAPPNGRCPTPKWRDLQKGSKRPLQRFLTNKKGGLYVILSAKLHGVPQGGREG